MFGLMLQKMWHKKWMNLCLLLGITLLVATLVSFPLYENAAYDRNGNELDLDVNEIQEDE